MGCGHQGERRETQTLTTADGERNDRAVNLISLWKKNGVDGDYQILSDLEAGLHLYVKIHPTNFGVQRIVLSPKAQSFAAPLWDLGLGFSFVLKGASGSLLHG